MSVLLADIEKRVKHLEFVWRRATTVCNVFCQAQEGRSVITSNQIRALNDLQDAIKKGARENA